MMRILLIIIICSLIGGCVFCLYKLIRLYPKVQGKLIQIRNDIRIGAHRTARKTRIFVKRTLKQKVKAGLGKATNLASKVTNFFKKIKRTWEKINSFFENIDTKINRKIEEMTKEKNKKQ